MLHVERSSNRFHDCKFSEFPGLLKRDDLLVFNNTKVFPARLFARRSGERAQPVSQRNLAARDFLQGTVEVLLNRQVGSLEWEALVRPGRKIGLGEKLFFYSDQPSRSDEPPLVAEVVARGDYGERRLRFNPVADFFAVLDRVGHVPLPPYIRREDTKVDREHYQTVYARESGSAAAPTAGLHFTPEILDRLDVERVTLHVGLDTFRPLAVDELDDHVLHGERYPVDALSWHRGREASRLVP